MPAVEVVVVIVNYRSAQLTLRALQSLASEARDPDVAVSVVVVENDSGDASVLESAIAQFSDFAELVVSETNGGFGAGNNLGMAFARRNGKRPCYFHLLNPDTEVRPGAIRELTQFMDANPRVGIAGSYFENEDGTPWPIAFRFPTVLGELESACQLGLVSRLLRDRAVSRTMGPHAEPVDWLPGASMMVRASLLEEIGSFDERYFLYYEETDLCLRARRAGWQVWYVPQSRVMHIRGQSTGVTVITNRPRRLPRYWFESRSRYYLKNHGLRYAMAADVAFLFGTAVGTVKRSLKGDPHRPHLVRDFLGGSVLLRKNRSVAQPVDGARTTRA